MHRIYSVLNPLLISRSDFILSVGNICLPKSCASWMQTRIRGKCTGLISSVWKQLPGNLHSPGCLCPANAHLRFQSNELELKTTTFWNDQVYLDILNVLLPLSSICCEHLVFLSWKENVFTPRNTNYPLPLPYLTCLFYSFQRKWVCSNQFPYLVFCFTRLLYSAKTYNIHPKMSL